MRGGIYIITVSTIKVFITVLTILNIQLKTGQMVVGIKCYYEFSRGRDISLMK